MRIIDGAVCNIYSKGGGSTASCEVLVFEPGATTPEDDAATLVGGGTAEDFVVEGFTEAAPHLMAARPLTLTAEPCELCLIGALAGCKTVDEIEEQLCELGKRCSGQNF